MKRVSTLICTIIFSFSLSYAQQPTRKITARIDSFYSINNYVVIKAHTKRKKFTILSKTYEKNNLISYKDSCTIEKGKKYHFVLEPTSVIKDSKGENLFLNLRGLNIGSNHILDAGELPYIAVNMLT